jgi:lipoprotein NlpI
MSAKNRPWDLLRSGEVELGLQEMRDAYLLKPDASQTMRLGVAYLWVESYEAAWAHFKHAIDTYPRTMSSFYGMAGVAKWCLDEPDEAINQWRAGLVAQYTDTAGLGLKLPLLLFFVSVVKPEQASRAEVMKLLEERAGDARAKYWPGPLVKFILGQIDESETRAQCNGRSESETSGHLWLADFYQGIRELEHGKVAKYQESMKRIIDMSLQEWLDEKFFLGRMWSEEYFLARHEMLTAR